jgi:succinoglycan biosynthesis protein ExoA
MHPLPFVSVVMPVRNERAYIERSLGAVLGQDYPAELMEIVVADGMSDDGTAEMLQQMAAADPRVTVIENPKRTTSSSGSTAIARWRPTS